MERMGVGGPSVIPDGGRAASAPAVTVENGSEVVARTTARVSTL